MLVNSFNLNLNLNALSYNLYKYLTINNYPVRTMLNLIYMIKIFEHGSEELFRRELSIN